jgi:hypothetical protein
MKRTFTFVLALTMVLTCCSGAALAATFSPQASLTLSYYEVVLLAGSKSGEIRINYDVGASKLADSLGVSSIEIYKSNGSYVTTITGTTSNGLVRNNSSSHMGVYSYIGTSGVSYYAKVTVFATVGSVSDSRTVTTSTVKAP